MPSEVPNYSEESVQVLSLLGSGLYSQVNKGSWSRDVVHLSHPVPGLLHLGHHKRVLVALKCLHKVDEAQKEAEIMV